MNQDPSFYTFPESMKNQKNILSASMEDYLEMIYRLSIKDGFTRVQELARALHVKTPSATSMIGRLHSLKLLKHDKYGVLMLEEDGKRLGRELLNRHHIIEEFLEIIGIERTNILNETEKIEHTVSPQTIQCLEDMTKFFHKNPSMIENFMLFKQMNPHP